MDSFLPPAVLSVATLINNAVSSAKNVRELAKQSADSDLKAQIGDLYDALLDMKERVLELDGENRSLREQLASKAAMKHVADAGYYLTDGDPTPFCAKCIEKDKRSIHLQEWNRDSDGVYWKCSVCASFYTARIDQS